MEPSSFRVTENETIWKNVHAFASEDLQSLGGSFGQRNLSGFIPFGFSECVSVFPSLFNWDLHILKTNVSPDECKYFSSAKATCCGYQKSDIRISIWPGTQTVPRKKVLQFLFGKDTRFFNFIFDVTNPYGWISIKIFAKVSFFQRRFQDSNVRFTILGPFFVNSRDRKSMISRLFSWLTLMSAMGSVRIFFSINARHALI